MATAQKTPPPVGAIVAASAAATNNTSYAGLIAPGQTVPLSLAGTNFYLSVATAPLWIRTSGQAWSLYQPGTGANVGQFSLVELYNSSANAITFQINCGTASFIDHRAVVPTSPQNVIHTVANQSGFGWTINGSDGAAAAPDLSGKQFTDAKGNAWIAVQRVACYIQTVQLNVYAVVALIQAGLANPIAWVQSVTGASLESGGTVAPPLSIAATGDLFFGSVGTNPGGPADCNIWEIYQAVVPGSGLLGTPPG
jgi:hypothetical protein